MTRRIQVKLSATQSKRKAGRWPKARTDLGVPRKTLLPVLNGEAGVSLQLALALERLGWSDAGHWVRMQGAYDLAQFRRTESAA